MGRKRYNTNKNGVNSELINFLKGLQREAKSKHLPKLCMCYKRAIKSIITHGETIRNGREAKQLKHIGPKISKRIDKFLQPNASTPETPTKNKKKKKRKKKKYNPSYRSPEFAMLIVLLKEGTEKGENLTQKKIIEKSYDYTDKEMEGSRRGFSGWNKMNKVLIKKKLVKKTRKNETLCYELTKTGLKLSKRLNHKLRVLNGEDVTDSEFESSSEEEKDEDEIIEKKKEKKKVRRKVNDDFLGDFQSIGSSQDVIDLTDDDDDILLDDDCFKIFEDDFPVKVNSKKVKKTKRKAKKRVKKRKRKKSSDNEEDIQQKRKKRKASVTGLISASFLNESNQIVSTKDESSVEISLTSGLQFKIMLEFENFEVNSVQFPNFIQIIDASSKNNFNKNIIFALISDSNCTNNSFDLLESLKKCIIIKKQEKQERKKYQDDLFSNVEFDKNKIAESFEFEDIEEDKVDLIITRSDVNIKDFYGGPYTLSKEKFQLMKSLDYDVILCLDNREKARRSQQYMFNKLNELGIKCERHQLGLGDMMWIVRPIGTNGGGYVLNYIAERKCVDDLGSSIKDGRYREQKFRLNSSGMERIYYIIEGDVKKQDQLPPRTLKRGMINISDFGSNFFIKQTENPTRTIEFLVVLTNYLEEQVCKKDIKECLYKNQMITIQQFNLMNRKNLNITAQELFGRQIVSLKGCSKTKAARILDEYPTMEDLLRNYRNPNMSRKKKRSLLENLEVSSKVDKIPTMKIGKSISNFIYDVFN